MQKSTSTNGARTTTLAAAIPVTVRMDKNVNCVIVTNSASGAGAGTSNNNGSSSGGPSTCWRGRRNKWKVGAAVAMAIALVGLGFNIWFVSKLFLRGDEKNICLSAACVRTAASLLSAMDEAVDPCEDFFMFACGNWNKRHLIPEDRSSVSTFEVLSDQIQVILKGLLEEGLTREDSEATKKAKHFYVSCMNSSAIKEDGLNAISGLMGSMGGWPVVEGGAWQPSMTIEKLVATIRAKLNINILIETWVGPDDTNSSRNVIQLDQMQLGLPSRDYFLNSSRELLAYESYMIELAVILGASRKNAEVELANVVDLEIRLANIAASEADRHDTSVIYKKMTLKELQSQVQGFDWREYFQVMLGKSVKDEDEFVTYAFPYMKEMADILRREELRTVQNYIMWRTLMELTSFLVGDFQEKKIEFRKVLMGITSERNRWHECVEWANKKLGFAVGALFIRENFDPQAKETAQEMIGHIREAFIDLLEENEWMDEPTRKLARQKALDMNERIGYPEFIKVSEKLNEEYENLTISTRHFLENIVSIGTWKAKQNFARLEKPVDRERWSTEPAVVNAFYDPNKNDIVFPAGILQPLFYSHQFPKSLNYGGIGVVIGHEITHGFDDKGRLYDKEGNMKEWWNNDTIKAFRTQAQCVIEQYSQYQIMNFTVNGYMTQGENIADNGGLKQAYRAFKKWEETHSPEPLLPGLEDMTHDQYFFLNYGQIWCGSMRYEDLLSRIRTAVHSPPSLRVLGPLSNSKDFSKAFKCKPGSRMNPVKKCSVW